MLPGFVQASIDNRYEPYLALAVEGWFERWPERDAVFTERAPDAPLLTQEELKKVNVAVVKRKLVRFFSCNPSFFQRSYIIKTSN